MRITMGKTPLKGISKVCKPVSIRFPATFNRTPGLPPDIPFVYGPVSFFPPDINFLSLSSISFTASPISIGRHDFFHRTFHFYRSPEFVFGKEYFLSASSFLFIGWSMSTGHRNLLSGKGVFYRSVISFHRMVHFYRSPEFIVGKESF